MRRPKLHFTPPSGWCNDPNGLICDGKYYHLFYQHHPHSLKWGPMHWGHARSLDLLSWEHLPIALAPDERGAIFSGSAVMDGGDMVLMYTYHAADGTESQAIARSCDSEFLSFHKYEGNPVIPNPGFRDFRDPKIFLSDAQGWHMILAAGDRVLFYRSRDLTVWEQRGAFGAPDCPVPGIWECPDLFPLQLDGEDDKWVLAFSLGLDAAVGGGKTMYFTGVYKDGAFTPDDPLPKPVDNGPDFYAGVTFWGTGKRIMMAWMNNWAYPDRTPDDLGWRGQMTLPRELSLIKTNCGVRLRSVPIIPEEHVKTIQTGGETAHIITDSHSVELFVPESGVSVTQVI